MSLSSLKPLVMMAFAALALVQSGSAQAASASPSLRWDMSASANSFFRHWETSFQSEGVGVVDAQYVRGQLSSVSFVAPLLPVQDGASSDRINSQGGLIFLNMADVFGGQGGRLKVENLSVDLTHMQVMADLSSGDLPPHAGVALFNIGAWSPMASSDEALGPIQVSGLTLTDFSLGYVNSALRMGWLGTHPPQDLAAAVPDWGTFTLSGVASVVPEPSAGVLMAQGLVLGGLAARLMRRRRNSG